MRVYHGTGIQHLESILTNGLRPRNDNKSNWEEFPSREDMVYLSTAYAPYFALINNPENAVILEVDLDELDQDKLFPDEDGIAQALSQQEKVPLDEVHDQVKDNLEYYQHLALASIDLIGNICYQGVIEPSKIKKVTTIDFSQRTELSMICGDPMISVMNYRLCGNKYRTFTEWLMGDRPDFDMYGFGQDHSEFIYKQFPEQREQVRKMFENRTGLTTVTLKHGVKITK